MIINTILLQLGRNPAVQDKLRAEIEEARSEAGGDIPFDTMMQLPYLDAVFNGKVHSLFTTVS